MKKSQALLPAVLALASVFPACAQKNANAGETAAADATQSSAQPPKRDDRAVKAQPVIEGDPDKPPAKSEADTHRITVQQLKQKMDANEDIVILDVRSNNSYNTSNVKIRGAIRIDPDQIEAKLKELPKDKEIITYCT